MIGTLSRFPSPSDRESEQRQTDAAFAVEPFEITDHMHAEIAGPAATTARPSSARKRACRSPRESVKTSIDRELLETVIKYMARRAGIPAQVIMRSPGPRPHAPSPSSQPAENSSFLRTESGGRDFVNTLLTCGRKRRKSSFSAYAAGRRSRKTRNAMKPGARSMQRLGSGRLGGRTKARAGWLCIRLRSGFELGSRSAA